MRAIVRIVWSSALVNTTNSTTESTAHVQRAFAYAYKKLGEYAADDAQDAAHLIPFHSARTLAELVAARDCIARYCACSVDIEELHFHLSEIAAKRL